MAGHQKAERIHGPRTRTCRDILWDTRLVESVFLAISEENRMAEGAQAQLGPSPGLWRPRGRARLSADTPSHPVTLRGGRLCQPQVVQISHIFHKPVLVIICFKKNPDCPSSQQQRLDLWTSRSRPCATPSDHTVGCRPVGGGGHRQSKTRSVGRSEARAQRGPHDVNAKSTPGPGQRN